ncbi:MAG: ATP-binding cassette domain-containing protein, partial [Candidatus Bipolaricaulia bacterium]
MQSILEVKELTKVYRQRRGEDVLAIDHISFSVNKNEVVGLLGPNGAGKTTTIKCLATLIEPTSGEIWIAGVNARHDRKSALERIAAVLEGNRNIYW